MMLVFDAVRMAMAINTDKVRSAVTTQNNVLTTRPDEPLVPGLAKRCERDVYNVLEEKNEDLVKRCKSDEYSILDEKESLNGFSILPYSCLVMTLLAPRKVCSRVVLRNIIATPNFQFRCCYAW